MHTILSLIKNNRLCRLKDFICHFHFTDTKLLTNLLADGCLKIMERRQAMHEDGFLSCILHYFLIHLIWR